MAGRQRGLGRKLPGVPDPAPTRGGGIDRRILIAGPGALGAVLMLMLFMLLVMVGGGMAASAGEDPAGGGGGAVCGLNITGADGERLAALRREGIDLEAIYMEASRPPPQGYDLGERGPSILAAINKIETNFGQTLGPSTAGARGWMQFMPGTWDGYGVDGDGDGERDWDNPADAIPAAANLLSNSGAPEDWYAAIFAYNHADWYVEDVFSLAQGYQEECETNPGGGDAAPGGPVELTTVRGITVNVEIADQLEDMLAAAERDGLTLTGSGYRSTEQQIALRRAHCGTSHYAIYEAPASSCSPPTAIPGTSMHELGLAIDFENCSSASTACFQWLSQNAARFGFYNLPSEPWHWSIDGT